MLDAWLTAGPKSQSEDILPIMWMLLAVAAVIIMFMVWAHRDPNRNSQLKAIRMLQL